MPVALQEVIHASAPGMSMVTFNLHHDREDWPSRRRTILAELKL
ncbi:endonuclease, partial [Stenotrophomonas maltophilia]